MVLLSVIAFAVLKILHNLVSIQKSLFANKWWSRIRKSVHCDLTFIFIELSETLNSFVKISLVLEIKKRFIKTRFYLKTGCMKMHKYAETFHANKGCKLAIVFFILISLFSKEKFRVQFSNVICTKTRPCTPLLFIWKWITLVLSFVLLEKNDKVFSSSGPVFPRVFFFFRG